ncbi:polyhydroxybutyrate depolymerase [Poseidonocella sp. HB161398]|uniref:alpha/beta hydrolase family esterase n=1 Tax=Poseidonocella sp. HB161398 TaxID=2320855 RepID=UPI001F0FC398|nr:polyhydroxybutyrate depolymerase [Poseidonocella sp. HB161398]
MLLRHLLLCLSLLLPLPAFACGGTEFCATSTGRYLLSLPDGPPQGAVVFLHGHGGSAEGSMRNREMAEAVLGRGYALAAAEGMPRGRGNGNSWAFRGGGRDEPGYFAELFTQLAERHGVPRDRILMAGFSAGGFMTSYLACAEPGIARGFAPVSGGFWRPMPESCAGPVRLFHTHGWSDRTVPLEGRYLGNAGAAQGDIFAGMELWRQANGCDAMRPDQITAEGPFWRRSWTGCTPGSSLEFALFPGGHMVPPGWAGMVLDWFEALP